MLYPPYHIPATRDVTLAKFGVGWPILVAFALVPKGSVFLPSKVSLFAFWVGEATGGGLL